LGGDKRKKAEKKGNLGRNRRIWRKTRWKEWKKEWKKE